MEMPPYGSRGKLHPHTPNRTFPPLPQGLENARPPPSRAFTTFPQPLLLLDREKNPEQKQKQKQNQTNNPAGVVKLAVP